MKSADLIREQVKAGWALDRVRGSHHVFIHPSRPGIVVGPHPKKDLCKGFGRKTLAPRAKRRA
jgi:predicted RNA binding protein YcfA (HicA-like mRNA interferase family)